MTKNPIVPPLNCAYYLIPTQPQTIAKQVGMMCSKTLFTKPGGQQVQQC
jgi:hypothetical protein